MLPLSVLSVMGVVPHDAPDDGHIANKAYQWGDDDAACGENAGLESCLRAAIAAHEHQTCHNDDAGCGNDGVVG